MIATTISGDDFGVVEDLIAVWRDDELLNALDRVDKNADSVPVPFDASADRQLVELLLAWRVNFEPDALRNGDLLQRLRRFTSSSAPCTFPASRQLRSLGRRSEPANYPQCLLLTGYLENEGESQRRGCSPDGRRNVQIVKLTREGRLGR